MTKKFNFSPSTTQAMHRNANPHPIRDLTCLFQGFPGRNCML